MKNLSAFLLLLVTVGELFGQGVAERMSTYLQLLADDERFNGSVLVAKGDQILLTKEIGDAAIEYGIPITPATKFRIGSITKQFTAMAVMQLVEAGKIDLEGKITNYLPDYPPANGEKITIHHLLTHSSGIPSYTGMTEIMKHRGSMEEAPEDFIKNFWEKELEFEPGSKFKYNNSGYYLLGMIIEKVSDMPYDEYVRQNIFEPLGMTNSGYEHYRDVIPNLAEGYAAVGDYPEKCGNIVTDMAGAAGALYATTEDLLKWHRALLDQKLISKSGYEKIFTPQIKNYGYGWTVEEHFGKTVYSHSGGIDGFRSMGILLPEEKFSVIVLSNLESANSTRIAQDLAKMHLGEPVEMPEVTEQVEVDQQTLEKYTGTYNLFPGFDIKVIRKEDQLMIHPTNQDPSPIFPETDTMFFSKMVNAKIEFIIDEAGTVSELVLHQNGAHPGKRVK